MTTAANTGHGLVRTKVLARRWATPGAICCSCGVRVCRSWNQRRPTRSSASSQTWNMGVTTTGQQVTCVLRGMDRGSIAQGRAEVIQEALEAARYAKTFDNGPGRGFGRANTACFEQSLVASGEMWAMQIGSARSNFGVQPFQDYSGRYGKSGVRIPSETLLRPPAMPDFSVNFRFESVV